MKDDLEGRIKAQIVLMIIMVSLLVGVIRYFIITLL